MRSDDSETRDIELALLLEAVYRKYNHDFRQYSPASLKRRLALALEAFNCESYSELQHWLLHDADALPRLLPYLTVQVSEFFRDPHYFRTIRENIIPHLRTYPSLKVWVAGCAGGEELYSLVILFREEGLEDRTIFYATDINRAALSEAQAGIYTIDRIALFTQNHRESGGKSSLADYYTTGYGRAKFDKDLRKNVVFSDHSLVSDSVFAETHLVSCRNVMIYFNRQLQDRVVGLFRESLVRKGFLGLGSRETLRFSGHSDAFEEFDRQERIYQKTR